MPFLKAREKEVAEIMVTLFNQQKVMELHDYHVALATREDGLKEGRAEGHAEGRAEGMTDGALKVIRSLMKNMGLSVEQALVTAGIPEAERPHFEALLQQNP